ncbi:MAG: phage major capsid protein [Firmicutes bacterium]|nr:phage major capsid protein [Bacillota bacterium]
MKRKEIVARLKDAQLRGKNILSKSEQRELTDEDIAALDKIKVEIDKYKKLLDCIKDFDATDTPAEEENSGDTADDKEEDPEPPKADPAKKEEKSFRNLGDQMMAVYRASQPGARIDSRLSTRSASGLNATNASDGGFLVETQFVKDLLKRTYDTGILASRCKKIPLTTNANSIKINAVDEISRANGSRWGGLQTYWENEADQFSASKPKFRQMELSLKKLTGLCYVTDELLQDAAALEKVIKDGFAEEFGFKMDDVILRGSGAGQPLGILNSDALVKVDKEKNQTAKITVENIVKMWSRMWSRSRSNAVWFINPEIEPLLYTLVVGDKPVYIPAGSMANAPYGTLLGRPVVALEQCSELGEAGDIILADLSQYLLIDKGGINTASSIHVRFLYDEAVFRFIYRVDGQPVWNKALKPYKGDATVSPFITLAKRGGTN